MQDRDKRGDSLVSGNIMRFINLLILSLSSACCFGQLAVTSEKATRLLGVESSQTIGDVVLVDPDANIKMIPVVIINADTDASNVSFEASDINRIPVDFIPLDGKSILVSAAGKTWVDVNVIDFEKQIYARTTVVVEVGESPPDPTPPGPEPPGPTPPDPEGLFDGLAARVALASAGVSDSVKSEIASVLKDAARKMSEYDFRTFLDVRDYIADNWPDDESARSLYKLLADDSGNRILSWQQAQQYYLEIVKGLQ